MRKKEDYGSFQGLAKNPKFIKAMTKLVEAIESSDFDINKVRKVDSLEELFNKEE